jgi:signal transduction histidine kinase
MLAGMSKQHTIGRRLTLLYGALFVASAVVLLVITNLVANGGRRESAPAGGPPLPTGPGASADTGQAQQLLFASAVALAVAALLSLGLGRLAAGRVLRPLRALTAATRRVSADNLHERLAVSGPDDEVKALADTIDELLGRLEAAFAAQRAFVANASHELRTPLATLRASLDVAEGKEDAPAQTAELAGRLRVELDRLDRLLEGLLTLARGRHGTLPDHADVPLDRLVRRSLSARADEIAARGLTVENGSAPVSVHGSPALLARLVDNLIGNAVTHNEDGGWIRVAAAPDGTLTVDSGGPVLDQDELGRLGRPFQRLGADRTGSGRGAGLGLSIVAAVAEAHGGALELAARAEGGLRVTVTLPRA